MFSTLSSFRPLMNLASDRLHALPLVIVYLTDGCNSRCVTCDIWKLPRRNLALPLAERLAGEFSALGVRRVIMSGGEAMQHPEWPRIANFWRSAGAKIELLTNGLLLNRQARTVIDHIDQLVVSLDGGTSETYQAIRGVDGFDVIMAGLRQCAAGGLPITTRTTIQRGNFRELPQIVEAARAAEVRKVSFLAVDVSSTQAFGPRLSAGTALTPQPPLPQVEGAPDGPPVRHEGEGAGVKTSALTAADLPEFAAVLDRLERDYAADFASGLIAESPAKLRRLYDYFAALNGLGESPAPRCNAPHISAVIEVDGRVRPCFFLPSVGQFGQDERALLDVLNGPAAIEMRTAYRSGQRSECAHCVCSLYQGARTLVKQAITG